MKKLLITSVILPIFLTIISCNKTSTVPLNEKPDTTAVSQLRGTFTGLGSEQVSGQAMIYLQNNKYYLSLENFSSSNGPDLKVYLSQGETPTTFIKLGDLKSTKGYQLYEIMGMPDFSKFKYALIHCEQFNHLYGRAELK